MGVSQVVELPEFGGSGYLWDTAALDAKVVQVVEDHHCSRDATEAIGGTNMRQLRLEPVAPGETSMTHRRPWNPSDAADTCHIRVVV